MLNCFKYVIIDIIFLFEKVGKQIPYFKKKIYKNKKIVIPMENHLDTC